MKKPKFQFTRITIDTITYDQLTELAFANRVTRAGYIRRLINGESFKVDASVEPLAELKRINQTLNLILEVLNEKH